MRRNLYKNIRSLNKGIIELQTSTFLLIRTPVLTSYAFCILYIQRRHEILTLGQVVCINQVRMVLQIEANTADALHGRCLFEAS